MFLPHSYTTPLDTDVSLRLIQVFIGAYEITYQMFWENLKLFIYMYMSMYIFKMLMELAHPLILYSFS